MSQSYRRARVQCLAPSGLYQMGYLEWGASDNPRVLICVHGLTRCARDFDVLAQRLSSTYRVVCPDVAGRGNSDWLRNPMDYVAPTYVNAMVALVARLGVEEVHWVGTSMGGIIGMTLASLPGSPIKRLVLNDVGPIVTAVSLARIAAYVGKAPIFSDMQAAEHYIRTVSAPFGPHSDEQWRQLTRHVVREAAEGGLRMHYDPAIAVPFGGDAGQKDIDLWGIYDAIACPTLLLRGELSDLLTRETAEAMRGRGPRAAYAEVKGVGHAPTLMHEDQIGVVADFLLGG